MSTSGGGRFAGASRALQGRPVYLIRHIYSHTLGQYAANCRTGDGARYESAAESC